MQVLDMTVDELIDLEIICLLSILFLSLLYTLINPEQSFPDTHQEPHSILNFFLFTLCYFFYLNLNDTIIFTKIFTKNIIQLKFESENLAVVVDHLPLDLELTNIN